MHREGFIKPLREKEGGGANTVPGFIDGGPA